jgi:hypothetical protein
MTARRDKKYGIVPVGFFAGQPGSRPQAAGRLCSSSAVESPRPPDRLRSSFEI